jgi:hypothetical protein
MLLAISLYEFRHLSHTLCTDSSGLGARGLIFSIRKEQNIFTFHTSCVVHRYRTCCNMNCHVICTAICSHLAIKSCYTGQKGCLCQKLCDNVGTSCQRLVEEVLLQSKSEARDNISMLA